MDQRYKVRKYFKLHDKEYSEYQNCGMQLKQCMDENSVLNTYVRREV